MPKSQDRLSVDDVLIPVTVAIPEGGNPDPSNDVVQFQFVNGGLPSRNRPSDTARLPTSTGWLEGFWITRASGPLLAGITVGPGTLAELPPGRYAIWIKVSDSPTAPVQAVDVLTIT